MRKKPFRTVPYIGFEPFRESLRRNHPDWNVQATLACFRKIDSTKHLSVGFHQFLDFLLPFTSGNVDLPEFNKHLAAQVKIVQAMEPEYPMSYWLFMALINVSRIYNNTVWIRRPVDCILDVYRGYYWEEYDRETEAEASKGFFRRFFG